MTGFRISPPQMRRSEHLMTEHTDAAQQPLFEDHELAQFDRDNVVAGGSICKMLSLFFLYTVIVMAIVGYWTYKSATQ